MSTFDPDDFPVPGAAVTSWDGLLALVGRMPTEFRVVRRGDGAFDVALIVDGGYCQQRDAEEIAGLLAAELVAAEMTGRVL